MIKKYFNFINEAEETSTEKSSSKFNDLKKEISSLIEKTTEKSGGEVKEFKERFLKNPNDVKIEGLINDSDIYDFYLKFRNDIDELLNDVNFFDEVPNEMNSFGLYDYLIKGTQRAIKEAVKMI